ncbi:MAG TPA: calcium-binding protein [Tepidisphaeraceae bacterium]|nr:calcium-binding protein [Tepidisphaeraceae bacterium]
MPNRPLLVEALEPRRLLAISFDFNIIDPGGGNSEYYDDINRVLGAAGRDWGSRFTTSATLQVNVEFEFNSAASYLVRSGTTWAEPIRTVGGVQIVELGGPHEIRTEDDPNGGTHDATITFNTFRIETLFWDPAPLARIAPIPPAEFDAYTYVLRELGHIVGFQGIKNPFTGEVVDDRMTTYDQFVAFTGPDTVIWTGPAARDVYGAAPPLNLGDISHYGNPGGPGSDLNDLLMSESIPAGEREFIQEIDLAFLFDMGLPVDFTGTTPPPPPVPPVLDLAGTNGHDIIEVIHTRAEVLFNLTRIVETTEFNPFTGREETVFERQTTRERFPAEGFTDFVIRGLRGNDRIVLSGFMPGSTVFGNEGHDTIIGGNRNDTLFGNEGNDQLYGGYGEDRLDGGGGRDYLVGGFDNDRMFGNTGHDTMDGSAGDDRMHGGEGNDSIIGGDGNDHLLGEEGNDELFGANGRDRLDGGAGADLLGGGNGVDTADYIERTSAIIVTLDEHPGDGVVGEGDNVLYNVEAVWGGLGHDRIVGTGANNILYGGPGNDSLDGGTGNDFLEGSDGDDVIDGMIGRDTIFAGAGNDRIQAGPDRDLVLGGPGNDRIHTIDRSADTINGGPGLDLIFNDDLDVLEDEGL